MIRFFEELGMIDNKKLVLILMTLLTLISCSSEDTSSYPLSSASYAELDSEIGCYSKYSDNKKEDIFNTLYKNHWMTWAGEVVLAEADNVSLNIDSKGTQDLRVDFADKNAGYNLKKGDMIKVKFIMKTAGGCFLPFSGKQAIIENASEKIDYRTLPFMNSLDLFGQYLENKFELKRKNGSMIRTVIFATTMSDEGNYAKIYDGNTNIYCRMPGDIYSAHKEAREKGLILVAGKLNVGEMQMGLDDCHFISNADDYEDQGNNQNKVDSE